MIFSNKNISVRQMQSLFITQVFGTSVVFIPSLIWGFMEGKGIIAIALGLIPLFVFIFFVDRVYKGENTEFTTKVKRVLGVPLAKIVFALFWVKIMFVSGLWLKEFSKIIVKTLLPVMPYWVVSLIIALICLYLGGKGIEVRGRSGEIFIEFMAIFFVPVIFIVALGSDYSNILPVYDFNLRDTSLSALYTFTALGSADYLLFLYPKVDSSKRLKGINTGFIVVAVLVLFTVATVYGVFGESVSLKEWAVLNMMDTVDFPGAFIERQDVLMIGFWIISFFIYISGGITYGGYLLEEITVKEGFWVNGIIIFAVSILTSNTSVVNTLLYTTPVFLIILPLILLITDGIKA